MRTVREFIRNGIAGIHIEDQLYPKRAHYHRYVVHGIPVEEFVEKIEYSCKQRDETDRDFVIIARTDTCRALGLEEASMRINRAADVGRRSRFIVSAQSAGSGRSAEGMPRSARLRAKPRQPRRTSDILTAGT